MTKRNKKNVNVQNEIVQNENTQAENTQMENIENETTSEKAKTMTKEEKREAFKQKSKQKFEEIMYELKNPVRKAVRRRKAGSKLVSILRGFIFFGLSFVIVFPIFEEISLAFRDPIDLNNKLVNWIPENYSLFNFKISIILLDYWKALFNNTKVSLISTVCQLIATSLAGYALSRLKFKGSNLIFWLLMLSLIVPPQAVSLSRSLYLQSFDLFAFGDHPGLFEKLLGAPLRLKGSGKTIVFYITSLTGQGIRAALFIFLFRQFFRGIPVELEESAQIDGAGVVRTFISVMLPNARGVITTVALFAFVWQWNDVYYVNMYNVSGDEYPMLTTNLVLISERVAGLILQPQYVNIVREVGEGIVKNPLFTQTLLNTAALLIMAPLLIAYLFVQRLFIEGVERSGIVG